MKKSYNNSISQNIKKYRLLNNMTQEELAGQLYLDTQYYAQLERGERNFTIEKIIQICKLFNIEVNDIIEIDTQEHIDQTDLLAELQPKLNSLSHSQLKVLERFITEIIPYIK